jgi:regulator of telomere elongation helicase 1
LLGTKAVVIEPKSSGGLPDAIAEFHKFLNLPKSKGVALFGVCRGKISEGIDFAHDMCRAVVITGLPFAPSFDPKVKMKREFLDQNRASQNIKASTNGGFGVKHLTNASLSGHEWYTQQAHTSSSPPSDRSSHLQQYRIRCNTASGFQISSTWQPTRA